MTKSVRRLATSIVAVAVMLALGIGATWAWFTEGTTRSQQVNLSVSATPALSMVVYEWKEGSTITDPFDFENAGFTTGNALNPTGKELPAADNPDGTAYDPATDEFSENEFETTRSMFLDPDVKKLQITFTPVGAGGFVIANLTSLVIENSGGVEVVNGGATLADYQAFAGAIEWALYTENDTDHELLELSAEGDLLTSGNFLDVNDEDKADVVAYELEKDEPMTVYFYLWLNGFEAFDWMQGWSFEVTLNFAIVAADPNIT